MSHYLQGTLETFRREELRARRQFTIAYMFAIVPALMTITLYSDLFDSRHGTGLSLRRLAHGAGR